MIDIASLKEEDIGRWVLYQGGAGEKEKGRLKSWNDQFIFVVYKCAGQWQRFKDYTENATSPDDLRWTTAEEVISVYQEESNNGTARSG